MGEREEAVLLLESDTAAVELSSLTAYVIAFCVFVMLIGLWQWEFLVLGYSSFGTYKIFSNIKFLLFFTSQVTDRQIIGRQWV
jgi:hypothetical protein